MSGAGFVNAHTHLYSGLAPFGMPAPAEAPPDFVADPRARLVEARPRARRRSLRVSRAWYVAEALRLGTVGLVDHHESPNLIEGSLDILADVCQAAGMPAVLCYGATERNGGRDEARRGLAECRRFIATNTRPLVRGVVGLHASFTVSDDTVREAAALCRELGTVLHVHVAEDRADVDDAVRRGWDGPLERLDRLGALPPGSILAHGVHLSEPQVRRAEELGCWLVQNPRSNRGNRVGYRGGAARERTRRARHRRLPVGPRSRTRGLARRCRAARRRSRSGGAAAAAGPRAARRALRREGALAARDTAIINLDAIRAQAAAEAPRLWSRMADL